MHFEQLYMVSLKSQYTAISLRTIYDSFRNAGPSAQINSSVLRDATS